MNEDVIIERLLAGAPTNDLQRYVHPDGVVVVAKGVHAECLATWALKHRQGRENPPNDPVKP